MFQQFLITAFPEPLREGILLAFKFAPIWLPIFLGIAFVKLWMTYVRANFINSQEYVLLELRLPQRVEKSPLAMEAVLAAMHHKTGESSFINRWVIGKVRPYFSLEMVSLGGKVHYFIWMRENFRRLIESNLYAEFPGIEISEAPDYTRMTRFDLDEINVHGCDFELVEPDPLPIKTYVDYGLDKDPKEVNKVDPMAHILEFLASAKSHEQIWIQILIRMNRAEKKKPGEYFAFMDWKQEARMLIASIRANPEETEERTDGTTIKKLSDGQKEKIKAIERSISKLAFDTIIRGIYISEADKFDGGMIPGLLSTFKQFNSETLNGFKPTRYNMTLDYPWQDFQGIRENRFRYKVFDAYRRRAGFYSPYKTRPNVLNTEELASIFHLPGEGVTTPTLQRVPSQRRDAPANLPT